MGLYKDVEVSLQYIGENDTRVLTLDGKKDVKKGDIFKTTEKEAKQLLRMYGYLYEIVSDEETEEDTTDTSNDTTNETSDDINNTENTENKESTEENKEDEQTEEEKMLDELRKTYKEKYNQEVPVNKKNDINWIKSKL